MNYRANKDTRTAATIVHNVFLAVVYVVLALTTTVGLIV
jgi:hypothetical protein